MAKFSLVGDEEEEPNSVSHKRQRTSSANASASASASTSGTSTSFSSRIERRRRLLLAVLETAQERRPQDEEEEGGASEEVEIDGDGDGDDENEEEDEAEDEEDEEDDDDERNPDEEIEAIDQDPRSAATNDNRVVVARPRSSNSDGLSSASSSISISLTDPDVLDCSICFYPLSIPVFQCENGHVACSSCCSKLKNKCPSCSWPIGYNRCRAIEKVLEAVRVSCMNTKYGCKELLRYSEKKNHDIACMHSPCSCPHPGCSFVSSSGNLYKHFRSKHLNCAVRILFNCTFSVKLNANEKFQILQEQNEGVIFLLNNSSEPLGNLLTVSCICHCSFGGFVYDIVAKTQGNALQLQSFTECTKARSNSTAVPATGFLLVPRNFYSSSNELKLELCIWSRDSFPENFQRSIPII